MLKDNIKKLKFLVLLMAVSGDKKQRRVGMGIINGYLKAKAKAEHEQR